tara:strand:+ start:1790 stop:1960 length:171 start_codon:yes stop_codon:yes gene_type:complete
MRIVRAVFNLVVAIAFQLTLRLQAPNFNIRSVVWEPVQRLDTGQGGHSEQELWYDF